MSDKRRSQFGRDSSVKSLRKHTGKDKYMAWCKKTGQAISGWRPDDLLDAHLGSKVGSQEEWRSSKGFLDYRITSMTEKGSGKYDWLSNVKTEVEKWYKSLPLEPKIIDEVADDDEQDSGEESNSNVNYSVAQRQKLGGELKARKPGSGSSSRIETGISRKSTGSTRRTTERTSLMSVPEE